MKTKKPLHKPLPSLTVLPMREGITVYISKQPPITHGIFLTIPELRVLAYVLSRYKPHALFSEELLPAIKSIKKQVNARLGK